MTDTPTTNGTEGASSTATEPTPDAVLGLVTDGAHTLIVAQFPTRADVEEANRGLLERMIVEPRRHRWLLISNEDIGEPGCKHWHSRPRWGILGIMVVLFAGLLVLLPVKSPDQTEIAVVPEA